MEKKFIFIPENDIISEKGYITRNEYAELFRKYSDNSNAIKFLADMLEE